MFSVASIECASSQTVYHRAFRKNCSNRNSIHSNAPIHLPKTTIPTLTTKPPIIISMPFPIHSVSGTISYHMYNNHGVVFASLRTDVPLSKRSFSEQ